MRGGLGGGEPILYFLRLHHRRTINKIAAHTTHVVGPLSRIHRWTSFAISSTANRALVRAPYSRSDCANMHGLLVGSSQSIDHRAQLPDYPIIQLPNAAFRRG